MKKWSDLNSIDVTYVMSWCLSSMQSPSGLKLWAGSCKNCSNKFETNRSSAALPGHPPASFQYWSGEAGTRVSVAPVFSKSWSWWNGGTTRISKCWKHLHRHFTGKPSDMTFRNTTGAKANTGAQSMAGWAVPDYIRKAPSKAEERQIWVETDSINIIKHL